MTSLAKLKADFLQEPDNKVAYDALADEYALAGQLIAARIRANLSQAQVAERMGTKQSEISRIEGGRQNISIAKLQSYADAVGAKLDIHIS